MKYRLLIDYEVIEFLESLSRKDRVSIRNRLVAIQDFPSHYSDYIESDNTGRRVDIHIFVRFAIKFWVDHADRHIKILDLHFADRSRG